MASFYRAVIFKESECYKELMKAKQAMHMKKMINDNRANGYNAEKGLLMVKLNTKKSMVITFANKSAINICGYDNKEIVGLPIDNLMPKMVSDHHK
jgi:hypothetical protein